ncbi:MAG: FAD-binding oxidoreductase [Ktedonobacteraceae bacterium]|nr:FAD-binding oxidoreductase [Ktedonobacteraceae bacterium]
MEELQVHNWFGNIVSSPYVVVQPESVQDIIAILKDTSKHPSPVRAVGSNHSMTSCGVAEHGTLVDMRKMNRILEIRPDAVTTEAGALYIDVAQELQKHNLELYVNLELGNLSMGSAACCGTKDASMPGEYGQVCSYASVIKMVTPSGELLEITEEQPELLRVARSSYGLFGIIYEVTFKVKPLEAMSVYHKVYSLDEFDKQLPALKAQGDSIMMYLNPFLETILVEFRHYHETKNPQSPTSWQWKFRNFLWSTLAPFYGYCVTKYVPIAAIRDFLFSTFERLIFLGAVLLVRGNNTLATAQQIRYPAVATKSKYTFSIWASPEEHYISNLRAYFKFCRDYYRVTGYRSNMISVGYRITQDNSSLFSYSSDGPVMTFDPVSTANPGWEGFLIAYNELCSRLGGVPLLNQSDLLTPAQVEKAYGERIATFERYRKHFDPTGRLLNDYFRKLLVVAESALDVSA